MGLSYFNITPILVAGFRSPACSEVSLPRGVLFNVLFAVLCFCVSFCLPDLFVFRFSFLLLFLFFAHLTADPLADLTAGRPLHHVPGWLVALLVVPLGSPMMSVT